MTGRNIARYMRLDRLIPEFKDAVDKGTLAMVAAVDLSYLNVKMQKLIQQVAEAEGKKTETEAGSGTAKDGKGDYKKKELRVCWRVKNRRSRRVCL